MKKSIITKNNNFNFYFQKKKKISKSINQKFCCGVNDRNELSLKKPE